MENKIFCIPYAGGSANVYRKMQLYAAQGVSIIPVELAGRGTRRKETFYKHFGEAVDDVSEYILKNCHDGEVVNILGYSMGSLIAYEVALRLEKRLLINNLIVSSNDAPSIKVEVPKIYEYPDKKLIEVLQELGNMEQTILEDERFWKMYSGIIRADFKLLYQYRLVPHYEKVKANIAVFVGNEDRCYSNIKAWSNNTEGQCFFKVNEGGHFSMLENLESFTKDICSIALNFKNLA